MKEFYTIKELSELHSVSTRTIEKRLRNLVLKERNKNLIPLDIVKLLEKRHNSELTPNQLRTDSEASTEDIENINVDYDIVEGFSNEEHQEFQKRLIEYPILKQELEYHKKASESHQRQMEHILRTLEQRNYIEAKEKKIQ